MPISSWFPTWSHWPSCWHWPFCPGVFIATLGFLAAIVTFWDKPPKLAKALCIALFFGLMWGEVSMMSKDRDAHDKAEKHARDVEREQSTMLGVLVLQNTTSNTYLADIDRKIEAAKGNSQKIAALRAEADIARKQADSTAKQLLVAMVPEIVRQMHDAQIHWYAVDHDLLDKYDLPLSSLGISEHERSLLIADREHKKSELASNYSAQLKPLMTTANYLRRQLLQKEPTQTPEDGMEASLFEKAVAGETISNADLFRAAAYLQQLANRVSPPPAPPSNITGTAQ